MEEKKKSNAGLIVLVVILLLACAGMGAFIFINKDKLTAKESTTTTAKNTKTDTKESVEKNDTYQVLSLSPIRGHAVVYNGEVYVNVYDTTPNIDDVYGAGKYQTLVQSRNNYKEYSFGNLTMSVDRNNKWLKLNTTNVKKAYNNEYGQAVSSIDPIYGIILLNSDNTVTFISTKDLIEGNTNTTKLDVTDISDVVYEDNGAITTYLVKSDGTKIAVNTLFK